MSEKLKDARSTPDMGSKSDPIDSIAEADSVTAAASAMAAVAAAAASNSKMSPSAAALFARNTVQKQPLLSAHVPSLPVSPTNPASDSNAKTSATSKPNPQPAPPLVPLRKDDGLPHHEVNIESLRIDLKMVKMFLKLQIDEHESKERAQKNEKPQEKTIDGIVSDENDETKDLGEKLGTLNILDNENEISSESVATTAEEIGENSNEQEQTVTENPNEALVNEMNEVDQSNTKESDESDLKQEVVEEKLDEITIINEAKTATEVLGNAITDDKDNEIHAEEKKEEDDQLPEQLEDTWRLANTNESLLRLLIMFSSNHDILRTKKTPQKKNRKDSGTPDVKKSSKRSGAEKDTVASPDSKNDKSSKKTKNKKRDMEFSAQIQTASDLTLSFYSKIQSEYDAFRKCLPEVDETELMQSEQNDEDSRIVLDLLPACISDNDATTGFFRACSAKSFASMESTVAGVPKEELKNEKVHVTSSDGGIEIRSSEGQNSTSSLFSKSKTTSSAMSVVNAIAGAATGVVGGITKRKNALSQKHSSQDNKQNNNKSDAVDDSLANSSLEGLDYTVQISREMLGLTVENVLERTIVRTVLANGAAKKAGAKVGSLIVKVGSVETRNLTHFETIDELRQSQRPLKLVLRRVGKVSLQGAREEMGRLIKGAGFGLHSTGQPRQILESEDFKNELAYLWFKKRESTMSLNNLQSSHLPKPTNKRSNYTNLGERLVWILTHLAIGLEREATLASDRDSQNLDYHKVSSKEQYREAAKSVSKVLLDFVTHQFIGDQNDDQYENNGTSDSSENNKQNRQQQQQTQEKNQSTNGKQTNKAKNNKKPLFSGRLGSAGSKKTQQRPIPSGNSATPLNKSPTDTPLPQIGDVLHRLQPFLSDPFSPPAALLRGEIIALLCDVLDFDTEMELAEAETSSSGSEGMGSLTDLGSAGSLLKLIVRNCPIMRSPGCHGEKADSDEEKKSDFEASTLHSLHAGNRFLAVVHRLAASRSTSARVTACSLGPVLWSHLDFPHQLQLRGVITRALHDVEVTVRKSTAGVLHEIAELVFDHRAVPWLVLMCERAMTDPEPQLRSAAMTLTWHLAEHLPNAFLGDASKGSRSLSRLPDRSDPTFAEVYLLQCKLLPVATRLAEDRTFSVRLAVAAQCDRLCAALGDHWSNVIIDILQALLSDTDERVRSEAALCLPRLVESVLLGSNPSSMSNGVLESLFPTALKLLKDPSTMVRVSLASSSGELLTLLVGLGNYEKLSTFENPEGTGFQEQKKHIDETLIPLVQRLLHDSDPEVTSAALRAVTNASRGNVKEINTTNSNSAKSSDKTSLVPVLSEEQVLRLLPTLSDLATSPQWRVRQSAVEIVPALLGCTQRLETRSRIAQLCVQLMEDEVDAVRRTAAECLCLGGGSLGGYGEDGGEWVTAIVIPHLQACKENLSAKQRMLCLKMVEVMLKNGVCPKESDFPRSSQETARSPERAILEIATSLCDDKVVNVRLNVGRVLVDVIDILDKDNLEFVSSILQKQIDDECSRERGGDRDVLFYAQKGILRAKKRFKN